MTPEQHDKAVRALREDPHMPPEIRSELATAVANYERSGGMASDVSEASATRAAPATSLDYEQKVQGLEARHPGVARAASLLPPGAAEGRQRAAAGLDMPIPQMEGPNLNPDLKNASKRPDLEAPPEWHPPTPAAPAANFDSVWGKLDAVKQAMPDWAGGGTEHFVEPSFEQFQREMATVLPPNAMNGTAYAAYKDMKYRQALQAAQAQGRGIVRDAFAKQGTMGNLYGGLTKAGDVLRSGAIGFDDAMTGGLAGTGAYMPHLSTDIFENPEPKSNEEIAQEFKTAQGKKELDQAYSPTASNVGFTLGILNPRAVGNVAAKPIAGAIGAAPAAFAGAAATTLAHDVPGVVLGGDAMRPALERAAFAGFAGAPLGIIGGALGNAAREEGALLNETTPLGEAKAGGARMRPIRGVDMGPINRGLEARARSGPFGAAEKPDVEGMLAADLREPFTARMHAREGELQQQAQPLREFEDAFAHERHPLKNTVREILEAKKSLIQSDGTVASVNKPEMEKLDNLLADVLSIQAQAPEYKLQPKYEQQLNQLDRAVGVYGDIGTPESFRENVKNIHEVATPTRPVTPVTATAPAAEARAPHQTIPDLGPYETELPSAEHSIDVGLAGERIRSLKEAQRANPSTTDVDANLAREMALRVDPAMAEQLGITPDELYYRLSSKPKNPGDIANLSEGVRNRNEAGSASKEPFPHYERIKRALHQDRDAFRGETGAIKQSQTFQLDNGQTVRGYSAANAQLASDIDANENLLKLLGLKKMPSAEDTADLQTFEREARGFGKGNRSPAVDEAFRKVAGESGSTGTLDQMTRYRAMKALEQRARLVDAIRFWSHPEAARLRADPIIQALIGPLERAGSLGALPGEVEQQRQLPPQADQPTLEEIQRLLQP